MTQWDGVSDSTPLLSLLEIILQTQCRQLRHSLASAAEGSDLEGMWKSHARSVGKGFRNAAHTELNKNLARNEHSQKPNWGKPHLHPQQHHIL